MHTRIMLGDSILNMFFPFWYRDETWNVEPIDGRSWNSGGPKQISIDNLRIGRKDAQWDQSLEETKYDESQW